MKNEVASVAKMPPRLSLEKRLYRALGQYDGVIYTLPPGDQLYLSRTDDLVIKTSNDGSELWIGTSSKWAWHCRATEARRLAWFILWTWWGKGTWFGLRRWAWYKLLSRQCRKHAASVLRQGGEKEKHDQE